MTSSDSAGATLITEDGGSGIETMTLGANSFTIIPDDDSTFIDGVYKTSGNTIKLYTGEANKSYSIAIADKATNKTSSSVKTDADGYVVLTVEDLMHPESDGVYTFMLNDTEINLYDGVQRYIKSAECQAVNEGETSDIVVTTTQDVAKVQLIGPDGGTMTVTESFTNDDGTKTWSIEQTRHAGEYEYSIKAKVGSTWIDEGTKVTVVVNVVTMPIGKVVDVTMDGNTFFVKVDERATKLQIIGADGGTMTLTRYNDRVKGITSYNDEGIEVSSVSRTLGYEVWEIEMILPAAKYNAIGKFGSTWNSDEPYEFTVTAE